MTDKEHPVRALYARRAEVEPFIAMDVLAAAKRLETDGRSVVHMEIGEPSFPAPRAAREAAARALEQGRIGYTEALGMPALRARIARHYRDMYGLDIPPARIAVTTGSSGGFLLAFLALFNPGDRVGIAAPGYPPYKTFLTSLGLEPVEIELDTESRWALDGDAIASTHAKTPLAGALMASPANPTGTVVKPQALQELCATCARLGIRLVSDEIYHGLTYGAVAETALRYDDGAIVVNSFSKYWCMTGWRIGWMVVPETLERPVERLAQNLFISAPMLSQIAAVAALDAREELEAVRGVYARNRALLLKELPECGMDSFLPADGAFYLYADIGRFTNDSAEFAGRLLKETGVAATPGKDFDRARGQRYLRLSFAGAEAEIAEAAARIQKWLR